MNTYRSFQPVEFGSDFHYMDDLNPDNGATILSNFKDANLYFSGRAAVYCLLQMGIARFKWKRVFFPDYYCHEVEKFLHNLPIQIFHYYSGPYCAREFYAPEYDTALDVYIKVNYFGMGVNTNLPLGKAWVIEDHTHDLLSGEALNSSAHFCFASLRKSVPIPAGGLLWSPKALPLPGLPAATALANEAAYMKLSAMLLKRQYLEGGKIDKWKFRDLFIASETLFSKDGTNAELPTIIKEMAESVSVHWLRKQKRRNYSIMYDLINEKDTIWKMTENENHCPFAMIFYFSSGLLRNSFRDYLIKNDLYPAILWPCQEATEAQEFSDKMISIHCDARYSAGDIEMIANIINGFRNV